MTTRSDLQPRGCLHLLSPADRAVLVDTGIDTGAPTGGMRALVATVEAHWLGVGAVVDRLKSNEGRRQRAVRPRCNGRSL